MKTFFAKIPVDRSEKEENGNEKEPDSNTINLNYVCKSLVRFVSLFFSRFYSQVNSGLNE